MAVDGLTDDFITTPDGIRIPAKMVSPDVAARAKGFTYDDAVNLGKNIVTTGKETSEEITDLFTKPWETTVGKAVIGSQLGAAAPLVKFGQDVGAIPKPTPVATAKDMQPQPPAPSSPPGGSPSSLPGMVAQTAMGASLPVGETSLKARVGGAPMGSYADEKKEAEAAAKAGMTAEEKAAKAQAAAADAVAAEQEGRARFLEQEAAREQELQEATKVERERRMAEIDAVTNDLNKLSPNIDPKAYWADKNNAEKVAIAFGVFLGGLGSGPNQALGIIENAIQRDIDAQQKRFENAKGLKLAELEAKRNAFATFRQNGLDDGAARLATRGLMLGRIESQLEATRSKYSSPEILAKADQAKAKIQQDLAKTKIELQEKVNNDARANAILQLQQRQFQAQQQAAAAAAAAKGSENYVPGVGVALDGKSKEKVQELAGGYNEAKAALAEMKKLREQAGGGEVLDRDLVRKMRAAQTAFIGAANRMQKFGALDKGATELLEKLTGGDITDFGGSIDAALSQAGTSLDNSFQSQSKPYMAQYEAAAKPLATLQLDKR